MYELHYPFPTRPSKMSQTKPPYLFVLNVKNMNFAAFNVPNSKIFIYNLTARKCHYSEVKIKDYNISTFKSIFLENMYV